MNLRGAPFSAGCFARDATILREVGHILLQLPYMDMRQPRRFLIAEDCFELSVIPTEQSVAAVIRSIENLLGRMYFPIAFIDFVSSSRDFDFFA